MTDGTAGGLRLLAMLPAYPPTPGVGSWLMTHQLLRALVERGHHVDVVAEDLKGVPYGLDGVNVWPREGKGDVFRYLDAADAIVTHVESAERPSILGGLHGVPVVRIAHNTTVFTEAALRRWPATLTVFNSQHMAARFAEHAGWNIVVRPPVHAADYATSPGEAVTLINLSEDKGADTFYALAERMPERQFLGVLGGYGPQVVPRGPGDLPNVAVLAHTPADRMRDEVYARTRVLLMPSAYESWGRTAVEAMASGIPVIAHPTPGLVECLGGAGVLVDRDDVNGWEAALRTLLDGRKRKPYAARALARAAELDPSADLAVWCDAVEKAAGRRIRGSSRSTG